MARQKAEDFTFIGHAETDSGEIVAVFAQRISRLSRSVVEERLINLVRQGLPHDETERALATWPEPDPE